MPSKPHKDLIVLAPGKDETTALRAMLARPRALGIRRITAEFQQHPDRDAGCRLRAPDFLRRECGNFQHALVMFDREGCGEEGRAREELEEDLERRLAAAGWGARAAVIVIVPELEVWVWNNTSQVDDVLMWRGRRPSLREWLAQEGFAVEREAKPARPKEALERALRIVNKRRSAAIYGQLAAKVSFVRCQDAAFMKLRTTLQRWFAGS